MAVDSITAQTNEGAAADLRDPALVKIRDLIYRISGIFHNEGKFYLLAMRTRRRMEALRSPSFSDYFDHLTIRPNRETEMRLLLNEITIGETYFFRSQPSMDAVSKVILPKLSKLEVKRQLRKIRVWNAGCSTGEEAYTVNIVLLESLTQKFAGWKFEIVATDLNENSIAKCREGLYGEYAVRNITPAMRERYFVREGNLFRIKDNFRSSVQFERLNLLDQPKMLFMKGFDLIFCCNVLIYFDGVAKKRTVEHFYNGLIPGGYFFLGECETLFGVYDQFRLVHFPGVTAYYKPTGEESAGGPA